MALLATGGFVLGLELGTPESLRAAPLSTDDTDGDGLVDVLETVRWMDPYQADSDGDGFSDLEELARHGDPQDAASLPRSPTSGSDVGIASFSVGSELHTLLAFYGEGPALFQRELSVGVAVFGQLFELPPSVYLQNASVAVLPAAGPAANLIVVDTVAPVGLLHALGSYSVYATLADMGGPVDTADTLNLVSGPGYVPLELVTPPSWFLPHGDETYVAIQSQATVPGVSGIGGGGHPPPPPTPTGTGIYRPLVPGGGVPVTWSQGEVCVQQTTSTGGGGGAMTRHLVQSASCQEADGSCSSVCTSLTGGIVETLDPISLIGG
jgi:hypothetical protein